MEKDGLTTKVSSYITLTAKHQSCHHIETSPVICSANQLTSFYMMATLTFNELRYISIGPTMVLLFLFL